MNPTKNDAKKLFLAKGTCSQLFFYIMNREYGHLQSMFLIITFETELTKSKAINAKYL